MATHSPDGVTSAGDTAPHNGETAHSEKPTDHRHPSPHKVDSDCDQSPAKQDNSAGDGSSSEQTPGPAETASVEDEPADTASTEEDEEESDEEEIVPLLERSPELSGKRERRTVERFVTTPESGHRRNAKQMEPGTGVRLGDCPVIEHNVTAGDPEDARMLHQVLFGRPGRPYEFRRNVRNFRGFPFKQDSPEYNKKKETFERYRLDVLRGLARLLDLSRKTGSREELALAVLQFLCDPKPSGRQVKKKKPRSNSGSAKKSSAGKKRGRPPKSSADADIDDTIESVLQAGSDSEDSDREQPPKKRASPKKAATKSSSTKPAKKPARSRKAEHSSSEDEPLVKKPSKPPTDAEIRSLVRRLLDGANLEEVTMKTVLTRVYARYPQHDLTPRKDFIKQTVKALIS